MFKNAKLNPQCLWNIIKKGEHVGCVLYTWMDHEKRKRVPFFSNIDNRKIQVWHSFNNCETYLEIIMGEDEYEDILKYQLNEKICIHCTANAWLWDCTIYNENTSVLDQTEYMNKIAFLIYDFKKNGNFHTKTDNCTIRNVNK